MKAEKLAVPCPPLPLILQDGYNAPFKVKEGCFLTKCMNTSGMMTFSNSNQDGDSIAFPGEVDSGSPPKSFGGNAQIGESRAVLCFQQNQNGSR